MKVELKLVSQRQEPTLVIEAPALTPELEELARRLGRADDGLLGWQGDRITPLEPDRLTRLYTQDKGVFAQDDGGETYALRLRLYELEEKLDPKQFVRISNSEMVNLKKVTALDLSLTGTIKLTLAGGSVCFVSRRNVKNIKKALGL